MPKDWPRCDGICIRNRVFTQPDIVMIRKLIREHPSWGRTKLSEVICQRLKWLQPNGRLKDRACRVALLRLERLGYVRLPPRKVENGGRPPVSVPPPRAQPMRLLARMPTTLSIELVDSRPASRLWNWAVAEYHYLGLTTPVGRTVRYLVFGDGVLVGAIGFSESAWSVAARNEALRMIGLDPIQSRQLVVANNRFLILPSVRIPNLASRLLSAGVSRIAEDWTERFGNRPILAETFVDPSKYYGTCYFAANWLYVGVTKGFTKSGSTHRNKREPKLLLLRGIDPIVHRKLEQLFPAGGEVARKDAA